MESSCAALKEKAILFPLIVPDSGPSENAPLYCPVSSCPFCLKVRVGVAVPEEVSISTSHVPLTSIWLAEAAVAVFAPPARFAAQSP